MQAVWPVLSCHSLLAQSWHDVWPKLACFLPAEQATREHEPGQ